MFFFVISRQNLKDECENFAFLIANKILIGVIPAKVSFLKSPKSTFFKKFQGQKEGVSRFVARSNSTFTNISKLNCTGKHKFLVSQIWHLEDRMTI